MNAMQILGAAIVIGACWAGPFVLFPALVDGDRREVVRKTSILVTLMLAGLRLSGLLGFLLITACNCPAAPGDAGDAAQVDAGELDAATCLDPDAGGACGSIGFPCCACERCDEGLFCDELNLACNEAP